MTDKQKAALAVAAIILPGGGIVLGTILLYKIIKKNKLNKVPGSMLYLNNEESKQVSIKKKS